jgi:hypothetical protein
MLQTTKIFAIYGRGVIGTVNGTDPFRFGVWLHSLCPDGCYAHVEVG